MQSIHAAMVESLLLPLLAADLTAEADMGRLLHPPQRSRLALVPLECRDEWQSPRRSTIARTAMQILRARPGRPAGQSRAQRLVTPVDNPE
jgi:hypothetical protein